jgi:hypothetical protein
VICAAQATAEVSLPRLRSRFASAGDGGVSSCAGDQAAAKLEALDAKVVFELLGDCAADTPAYADGQVAVVESLSMR